MHRPYEARFVFYCYVFLFRLESGEETKFLAHPEERYMHGDNWYG